MLEKNREAGWGWEAVTHKRWMGLLVCTPPVCSQMHHSWGKSAYFLWLPWEISGNVYLLSVGLCHMCLFPLHPCSVKSYDCKESVFSGSLNSCSELSELERDVGAFIPPRIFWEPWEERKLPQIYKFSQNSMQVMSGGELLAYLTNLKQISGVMSEILYENA